MPSWLLFGLNLAVLIVLTAAFFVFKWSGPGLALGFLIGAATFFVYFRLKRGYWP